MFVLIMSHSYYQDLWSRINFGTFLFALLLMVTLMYVKYSILIKQDYLFEQCISFILFASN